MFKLVVLSALLAVVAAKPGFLHGNLGYAGAIAAPAIAAVPAAVSHSYRTDIISRPVIAHTAIAAPVAYAAPAVVSHAAYAAPAVGLGVGHLGYAGHLGYGSSLGLARAGHLGYAGHHGYGLGLGHHLKFAHY